MSLALYHPLGKLLVDGIRLAILCSFTSSGWSWCHLVIVRFARSPHRPLVRHSQVM